MIVVVVLSNLPSRIFHRINYLFIYLFRSESKSENKLTGNCGIITKEIQMGLKAFR